MARMRPAARMVRRAPPSPLGQRWRNPPRQPRVVVPSPSHQAPRTRLDRAAHDGRRTRGQAALGRERRGRCRDSVSRKLRRRRRAHAAFRGDPRSPRWMWWHSDTTVSPVAASPASTRAAPARTSSAAHGCSRQPFHAAHDSVTALRTDVGAHAVELVDERVAVVEHVLRHDRRTVGDSEHGHGQRHEVGRETRVRERRDVDGARAAGGRAWIPVSLPVPVPAILTPMSPSLRATISTWSSRDRSPG